jgi:hypothetical protein
MEMANTHRLSIVGAVLVCFVGVQGNATLFASENTTSLSETRHATSEEVAPADASVLVLASTERAPLKLDVGALAANLSLTPLHSSALGQVYRGRPYRPGNNNGSIAALMIGTAAAITGAALLIYANRPECTTNQFAGACGYGTKVIGGAVLTGGAVGLVVGALTWK